MAIDPFDVDVTGIDTVDVHVNAIDTVDVHCDGQWQSTLPRRCCGGC